jgi:hypothetical protein
MKNNRLRGEPFSSRSSSIGCGSGAWAVEPLLAFTGGFSMT